MNKLRPKFKLWLSTNKDEGVFGDGKWRLLGAIEQGGSLRSAAKSLGISYRKAWGDLRKAERCLGVSLVEKSRGGSAGGETRLTRNGALWLKAYSCFRGELEQAAARALARHIRPLA